MNDEIVVIHHLVATSLRVMWCCHVVVAVIVGVGDGCRW